MREQENINARWGRVRADQTDTAARTGLEDDLSSFRATLSANDAGTSVATVGLLDQVREIRDRDRRIEGGNRRQEVFGAENRARAQRPGLQLAQGFARAGPSLAQLYGSVR